MDSEPYVKDFVSYISCDRILIISRPRRSDRNKKRLDCSVFQITVCYTYELNGVAVPPREGKEWPSESPTSYYLSISVVRSSGNFIAIRKMLEGTITLQEREGRVITRHRNDILHSYNTGYRMITIYVHKHVEKTAIGSSSLETGFF